MPWHSAGALCLSVQLSTSTGVVITTINPKKNAASTKARNATVIAGVDKDLPNLNSPLAGVVYTPTTLKAVFQADSDAIDKVAEATAAKAQAVKDARAAHKKTAIVYSALRSYLLALFGREAVAVFGDFGMKVPASPAKTVASKAAAVVKAKATRAARGTGGTVQKAKVKGNADTSGIVAAINAPVAAHEPAPPATTAGPSQAQPATVTPPVTTPPVAPAPKASGPAASGGSSPAQS